MPETNKQIRLASRPSGWVTPDNFTLTEEAAPEPADGQLLLRNIYMSVDPYMRGRMNDRKSYVEPFGLGEVLQAGVVAEVMESRSDKFSAGDIVTGMAGWENYSLHNGADLRKIAPGPAPLSYHLGILGMPGMTAYVGLVGIGEAKEGEQVYVSAASGAVGSVVGQIAKNLGCWAAGSAGSDEKVALLKDELGFDAAFNYKTTDSLHSAVHEVCPKGIDVYFENVGGAMLEAALFNMNPFGRIALCGMIADYNVKPEEMPPGPRGMILMVGRSLKMQGFIVFNYPELCQEWVAKGSQWLNEGKLKYRETVAEGIENAPAAFIGMLKGENIGKQIVKLADE
ncbi:MAG: NADP-dependent oxidoreductase [Sphingomonadales bacterium]|nr:NADP-dependent oxidoreductase [Sphingomonadales bacterium]